MTAGIRGAFSALVASFAAVLAIPILAEDYAGTDSEVLPPDFQGTITYSGTHAGEVVTAPLTRGNYKPRPGSTAASRASRVTPRWSA